MIKSISISKFNNIYLFFSILIFISFIIGFYFEENAAGGGNIAELKYHWSNYKIFLNNNFFEAIQLTKEGTDRLGMSYGSSRSPLLSIIQAYLIFNFETTNVFDPEKLLYFKLLSFLISLLCLIIFFIVLKKQFRENSSYELFFLASSILLLSPYFRTSAFWGFGENYTFITTLLSFLFIIKFKNYLFLKVDNFLLLNLLAISFFSSLVVYFDVKAVIVPLICYMIVLFSKTDAKNKFLITLFYFIFSLPFLYLIQLWENIIPPTQVEARAFGNVFKFENIGYTISIIAFYILPMLFFKYDNFLFFKKKIFNKKFLFFIIFSVLYLIVFINNNNLNNEIFLGKGFLHKLSHLIFNEFEYRLIFLCFSFIFSFLVIYLFFENINDYLIILFFLLSSLFTTWLFQEYFDPLIYLLVFTFFSTKIFIKKLNLFLIFFYQVIFLTSAILYYN